MRRDHRIPSNYVSVGQFIEQLACLSEAAAFDVAVNELVAQKRVRETGFDDVFVNCSKGT